MIWGDPPPGGAICGAIVAQCGLGRAGPIPPDDWRNHRSQIWPDLALQRHIFRATHRLLTSASGVDRMGAHQGEKAMTTTKITTEAAVRATIIGAIRAKNSCENKHLASDVERTIDIALRHLNAGRVKDAAEQADMAAGMMDRYV